MGGKDLFETFRVIFKQGNQAFMHYIDRSIIEADTRKSSKVSNPVMRGLRLYGLWRLRKVEKSARFCPPPGPKFEDYTAHFQYPKVQSVDELDAAKRAVGEK